MSSSHHVAAASSNSATIKKEEHTAQNQHGADDDVNKNCDSNNNRLVKKEVEEEEEKTDGEINYCNNKKEDDDEDDCFADWKVGNWCWVLSSTASTTVCNGDDGTTATQRQRSERKKRAASTRSSHKHNTSSINNEDTPKKKKARSLSSPLNRNNADIKREEEDCNCDNNEVNNKMNGDDDDDDDGYESWTEGNWCLLLPTGSSTSTTVRIRTEQQPQQQHSSKIAHASTKHRSNCRKMPTHTAALHADDDDDSDDEDNSSSSNDDEPEKSRTGRNTITYTKWQNEKWNEMFHRLISYKNQHNSTNVSQYSAADPKLGGWVSYQRRLYYCRNESISDYRVNLLNSIGFVWSQYDNQWDEMFQRLVTYKKQQHGSTTVPWRYEADPKLAAWVRQQRYNYNNSNKILSVDRIERLESIGFVWDAYFADWMTMYDRLAAYKKKCKSTQVPWNYNGINQLTDLGHWVYGQRALYRDGKLLKKRLELLNSIDFAWEAKRR